MKLAMTAWTDGGIIWVECDVFENDEEDSLFSVFSSAWSADELKPFLDDLQSAIERAQEYEDNPPAPDSPDICDRCKSEFPFAQQFGERHFCSECIAIVMRLYVSDSVSFSKFGEGSNAVQG